MPEVVLDLPMQPNSAAAKTVRDYLTQLFLAVWLDGERFSSVRPFGTVHWKDEIYAPLIEAGLMQKDDHRTGDKLVAKAILSMTKLARSAQE